MTRELSGSCLDRRAHHSEAASGVVAHLRLYRQRLQRLLILPRERRPPRLGPALELGPAREVEPVQERAAVQLRRPLEQAGAPRLVELPQVARDGLAIQPELARAGDEPRRFQAPADPVGELAQTVGGRRGRRLGPQECEQLLTRDAAIARAREHGQQRHSLALERVLRRARLPGYARGAEDPEPQRLRHVMAR